MSELSGPADRGRMRVGDADREQAANVLREAAGQGRISMDELDERLELAYAAKTYADLTAVTHDLPQAGTALSQAGVAPAAARIGGTPRNKFSIAIMSDARHVHLDVLGHGDLDAAHQRVCLNRDLRLAEAGLRSRFRHTR